MTSGLSLSPVLLQRITRDHAEQPGLRLTPQQAQRLWGLDGPTCGAVLIALVDVGVLQRSTDRQFMRRRERDPLAARGGRVVNGVPPAPASCCTARRARATREDDR